MHASNSSSLEFGVGTSSMPVSITSSQQHQTGSDVHRRGKGDGTTSKGSTGDGSTADSGLGRRDCALDPQGLDAEGSKEALERGFVPGSCVSAPSVESYRKPQHWSKMFQWAIAREYSTLHSGSFQGDRLRPS